MPRSVAVFSDIDGVLPVLDAVLAEPDVAGADLVVVTGDHAAGPMPVEVLDRLVDLGPRCVLVRGNADRELVAIARGGTGEHPESVWAAGQLRPDQVALLAGLPHPVRVEVDGFGPVVCWQGWRPRSRRCSAATPTCRSSAWSTAAWWSTPAASGCPTAGPAGPGRCC